MASMTWGGLALPRFAAAIFSRRSGSPAFGCMAAWAKINECSAAHLSAVPLAPPIRRLRVGAAFLVNTWQRVWRMSAQPGITSLLSLAARGDKSAQEELFRLVEGDLRRQARACMRQAQPTHLLQTTVLIDEAFVKLVGHQEILWENRSHFYCFTARVMRQVLVDEARQRGAEKRGSGVRQLPLQDVAEPVDPGRSWIPYPARPARSPHPVGRDLSRPHRDRGPAPLWRLGTQTYR